MYNQNILIKVINKMSKVTDNLHNSEIRQNIGTLLKNLVAELLATMIACKGLL